MAESKCGRYSIRDRIYYGRLFIGSKNKLVQRIDSGAISRNFTELVALVPHLSTLCVPH